MATPLSAQRNVRSAAARPEGSRGPRPSGGGPWRQRLVSWTNVVVNSLEQKRDEERERHGAEPYGTWHSVSTPAATPLIVPVMVE